MKTGHQELTVFLLSEFVLNQTSGSEEVQAENKNKIGVKSMLSQQWLSLSGAVGIFEVLYRRWVEKK